MNSSVKFLWILKCHIYVFLSQAQLLWIKSQRVWLFIDRYGSACNSLPINWLRFGVEALESVYWMKNNGYAKYHLSLVVFQHCDAFVYTLEKPPFSRGEDWTNKLVFFTQGNFRLSTCHADSGDNGQFPVITFDLTSLQVYSLGPFLSLSLISHSHCTVLRKAFFVLLWGLNGWVGFRADEKYTGNFDYVPYWRFL